MGHISTKRALSYAAITVCLFMIFSLMCNNRINGETIIDNHPTYVNDSTSNREEAEKLLKRFDKKYFILRNATVYKDPRCPKYLGTNNIYIYIVKQKGEYKLRLKTQYSGKIWLITRSCRIITKSGEFILLGEFERGTEGNRNWETLDVEITKDTIKILETIANSETVSVRYIGMKHISTRELSSKEISVIKKTLFIYQNIK